MATITTHKCDFCGGNYGFELSRYNSDKIYDMCKRCERLIVQKAIKHHYVGDTTLRPFCEYCLGVGYIEEKEFDYDHLRKVRKECEACKLC